jgi:hypothetical protein
VAFNLVKSFMGEETQKKIVILGGTCLHPWSLARANSVLVWRTEAAAKGRLHPGQSLHNHDLASSAHRVGFQFQIMAEEPESKLMCVLCRLSGEQAVPSVGSQLAS